MFFRAFKENSNKKYLNKTLSNREVNVDNSKVESLGIVLNMAESKDFSMFKTLADKLKIHSNNLKVVGFSNEKIDALNTWDLCFGPDDFGWNGSIKSVELQSFLDKKFDVLISYYATEDLELKLITALSKAKFKVGILQSDERLNDLIIKTSIQEFNVFENEVFKYITILNKTKNEY
ncbi:hypothetical protein KO566_10855 [Flavobacteriaceae bacterium XHP0103]|uniref:DUF6913 domain-containing protein n=1 Tax=Marixanthotalea marina TaxID=2844359 RepID=UPI002989CBDD|nr:hypothetical protein [Marixanthotalea marina]MBU3822563.1 hypothetical protein [Marixanthotalea marina]